MSQKKVPLEDRLLIIYDTYKDFNLMRTYLKTKKLTAGTIYNYMSKIRKKDPKELLNFYSESVVTKVLEDFVNEMRGIEVPTLKKEVYFK